MAGHNALLILALLPRHNAKWKKRCSSSVKILEIVLTYMRADITIFLSEAFNNQVYNAFIWPNRKLYIELNCIEMVKGI